MLPFMPINEMVLNSSLELFNKMSVIFLGLLSMVFMFRMMINVIGISDASDYGSVFFDFVTYLALISLFPFLVKLIFNLTNDLAMKIYFTPVESAQTALKDFIDRLVPDFVLFHILSTIGGFILIYVSKAFYTTLLSLMLAIAPLVLFATTLGQRNAARNYFAALISLSLWPVVWNLIGFLAKEISTQFVESPLSTVCFWFVIHILQLFSPIFSLMLLKTLSPEKSVQKVLTLMR